MADPAPYWATVEGETRDGHVNSVTVTADDELWPKVEKMVDDIAHDWREHGLAVEVTKNGPREDDKVHSENCWCHGTGFRNDIGAPCNMGIEREV